MLHFLVSNPVVNKDGHFDCVECRSCESPTFSPEKKTRSSTIRRESAHLTWLCCTAQKAFQYETRMDHECDSTLWRHLSNEYKTPSRKPAALSTACGLSLTHSFGVNPKLRITKFGAKKLDTSLRRTVLKDRQIIILFCHNTRV